MRTNHSEDRAIIESAIRKSRAKLEITDIRKSTWGGVSVRLGQKRVSKGRKRKDGFMTLIISKDYGVIAYAGGFDANIHVSTGSGCTVDCVIVAIKESVRAVKRAL